jgi:adenosine deaminase
MNEHVLLCLSGSSPMVVPEAFLTGGLPYRRVFVLTSESERSTSAPILPFFDGKTDVEYGFHRVKGFRNLADEHEHERFQETLYRWYLRHRPAPGTGELHVCLTGGFKSMSTAMQKTARLFGADSVFHVLLKDNPADVGAVLAAHKEGLIRRIELGFESGHRLLRDLSSDDFPLSSEPLENRETTLDSGSDFALSRAVDERETVLRRLGDPSPIIDELPFRCLGFLPDADLDWLRRPIDPNTDASWVLSLPKVELHSHLGGFATHGSLLAEVRSHASGEIPDLCEPELPAHWPLPSSPIALDDYMRLGDATGSAILKDPGCLRHHLHMLVDQLSRDNVLYAEIRCSPANYADDAIGRSALDVLEEIRDSIASSQKDLGDRNLVVPEVNLIIIVTRRRQGDLSRIAEHVALATTAAGHRPNEPGRVVGLDLAGFENPETRPEYFETNFEPAHRKGLAVTVHAGENDDAEAIWQAVYRLSARRIGHGLRLLDAPHLLRAVADRGIGIELCPYANYQIKGFAPMPGKEAVPYPLLPYLEHGVKATVNVDNLGISAASNSDNLLLLPRISPGIRRLDLLQLIRNALDVSFLPVAEKPRLRSEIEISLAAAMKLRPSL